jgi:hypothetical protein
MILDNAGAAGQGEAGSNGIKVLAEGAGEGADRPRAAVFGLSDPLTQQVAAAATDNQPTP